MSILPAQIIAMTDKHEKGRALEALSQLLLTHYGAIRITTPRPDRGIDRMGLMPDGSYIALQSKAYDGKSVGKSGWQSFSEEVRRINSTPGEKRIKHAVMFSTARDGASREAQPSIDMLRAQIMVSEWYRERLTDPDNAYLWDDQTPKPEPRKPYPYQLLAIKDAKKLKKRGKVIMATGTGKTVIAAELLKHYGGLCLVLVPNMELVRQISHSLNRDTPDAALLAVFSGEDVRDDLNLTAKATTSPAVIRDFAKQTNQLRVIVSTYQSSGKVSEALKGLTVNFAVLDEAHRTVGGASKTDKGFQVCMNDTGIKIKRRLFMTATPKLHGFQAKKDAEDEAYILYSMDDEEQYGNVLHKLTPGKAIEDGLLAPFDVQAGLFRHARAKQYLKTDAKKYARDVDNDLTVENTYLAAFLLLNAQEENLKRNLVFTSNVERARLAAKALNTIAAQLDVSAHAHVVSYKSTSEQRREALLDLAYGRPGFDHVFVIQVDLFTEGVDIPALDSVVFVDARKSTIAITQAMGRALRLDTANPTKRAKIVIPIMITEKEDIDNKIEKSAFKHIRDLAEAIKDAGFSPEQLVIKAKETGAATLGDAWSDEEGVEFQKWANSDIEKNQTLIETIILGQKFRVTLERIQEKVKSLGLTFISAVTPILKTSNVLVVCQFGHVRTTNFDYMCSAKGCADCVKPRWTLARIQELLKLSGQTLVSADTPIGAKSKITVVCINGHTAHTTVASMRNVKPGSTGCDQCVRPRWTPDRLQEMLNLLGHTLVSAPSPLGAKGKIVVECENGHTFDTQPTNLVSAMKAGTKGCLQCTRPPNTLEQITRELQSYGLVLVLQPTDFGDKSRITVRCISCGYEFERSVGAKGRCSPCVRGAYWDEERVLMEFAKVDLTPVEFPTKISSLIRIRSICSVGHECYALPSSVHQGIGCPKCGRIRAGSLTSKRRNGKNKHNENAGTVNQTTFDEMTAMCSTKDYILIGLRRRDDNGHLIMQFRCPDGHEGEMLVDNFKHGKGCQKCSKAKMWETRKREYGPSGTKPPRRTDV